MLIEHGIDYSTILMLAPFVAITINQVKAIINRDNHQCTFPDEHNCHGKLGVHHIDGKDDDPNNITTVCREAHWEYLHGEASVEQKSEWQNELSANANEKTVKAIENGWIFPEK